MRPNSRKPLDEHRGITMAAGLAERGQQVKIKHSKHSKLRLNEARDALNIVHQVADDFAEQVKRFCETSVSDRQWAAFLDEFAPVPDERSRSRSLAENKRQALDRMWRYDDRVSPWAGSGWGVMQAVNTFVHHEQTVRGASRAERNALRTVTGGVDDLDRETSRMLEKVLHRPVLSSAA
ncbi:DUF932 domain-containing protein [Microbispora hainanensis]|uniref:DUF932 domain-containing protein n=2 Tax=Microbispora hainanensis TaxID=568844 RepID=A0A544Y157_9ACTN|nr:DUF932 domain-containing protein [Microbispora hainanensis]